MGVHPYIVMSNSPQALASNDTGAAETSTGFSYPVVFPPEENTGSSNNIGFPPTTDQMSSSVPEGGLVPLSSYSYNNSQGYYYNIPTNVTAGSDHGISNHNTAIVAPLCPTVDTSLPLESKTPAEYALSILFRQFSKVAEKKLFIIMSHSVV